MSFIKLDTTHQKQADALCEVEQLVIKLVDSIEFNGARGFCIDRWLSVGRTDIEKGFMALRKGVTEKFKESNKLDE